MNLVEHRLTFIQDTLMEYSSVSSDSGLFQGKLGVSIFFFHLAERSGNPGHQIFAEKLVDEVFEQVFGQPLSFDFGNGLAGIAWGIEYLVNKGFCEADIDEVLSDVDDKIFQFLVNKEDLSPELPSGILGYLIYLMGRLRRPGLVADVSNYFIFNRLLIHLINKLYECIDENKLMIREPMGFNILWDLPACLMVVGKILEMGIYLNKIQRIVDRLSDAVLSLYPRLQSNRINLILGMESILQHVHLPMWRQHSDLLRQNIQIQYMLDEEIKDKSIHLTNGIAGIAFILQQVKYVCGDDQLVDTVANQKLVNRFLSSSFWQLANQHEWKGINNIGLMDGLAGVGMQLLTLTGELQQESLKSS